MMQYFFIKATEESGEVFNMKKFCVLLLICLRDALKKALMLVFADRSDKHAMFWPILIQEALQYSCFYKVNKEHDNDT